MSFTTQTVTECMWQNLTDFAPVASSAAEATLLGPGDKEQPTLPPLFFYGKVGRGRLVSLEAQGVFSNTGTPTLIFQVRASTTQGSGTLTGTSLAQSVAVTTGSGVANVWWRLRLDLVCTVPGQGSGQCTLAGSGFVESPAGFASPFKFMLAPASGTPGTWTSTLDGAQQQYLNLSATWSAASASNTITCKQLLLKGWN